MPWGATGAGGILRACVHKLALAGTVFGNALARINGFIASWQGAIPMTGVIFVGG